MTAVSFDSSCELPQCIVRSRERSFRRPKSYFAELRNCRYLHRQTLKALPDDIKDILLNPPPSYHLFPTPSAFFRRPSAEA
jgi:hypothetical protein